MTSKKEKYPHFYTSEYQTWSGIRQRCLSEKSHLYYRYGAVGIGVSREWESYDNFIRDMGNKPSESHSIDRIDNGLGYSKENCRWATKTEQTVNRGPLRKKSTLPIGVAVYGKYIVSRIAIEGKRYTLGLFSTPEIAHEEYRKVHFEWYGRNPPKRN